MRVALGVDSWSNAPTGIGRYTHELALRLARSTRLSDLKFYHSGGWIRDVGALCRPSEMEKREQRLRWPRVIRTYLLGRSLKGAIFHGPNYFLPPFVRMGVITIHDLSVFRFPDTHPDQRRRQFEQRFSDSVARAAHIITCSRTSRDEVIAFTGVGPEHVTAVALAASTEFHPRAPDSIAATLARFDLVPGGYGLCVATLDPRKKLGALVRAWRRLPHPVRNRWPLAVVGGDGWLQDDLQGELNVGVAEGWLRRLGYVPQAELVQLYAGAGLFAYPSMYEGFGLPPIEAMACGVPVLVSNRSCMPEVTQGAALMIDPDDGPTFTVALERALSDSVWRAEAVARGFAVAASYSWDRCAEETMDVYRKALSSDGWVP